MLAANTTPLLHMTKETNVEHLHCLHDAQASSLQAKPELTPAR